MSKKNNILGVAYFGLGTPGDGVMGATLTQFKDVEVGSITIEGSQANDTTIPTESDDAYISISDTATPATITARLYGVTPTDMVMLAGGSVAGAGDPDEGKWLAPGSIPNIYLSLKMEGQAIDGEKGVLKMPYAKVTARIQGTITKNGLPAVDLTITANTPESAAGVKGAPLIYGTEAAV
jgi:hypothetical protein